MPTKKDLITPEVRIIRPARSGQTPSVAGYDIVVPIGPGPREPWTKEIEVIFLTGVPRALREGGRAYLLQGRDIFWSVPVLEVLTDTDRISWITHREHAAGPSLFVDLPRGRKERIDAASLPSSSGLSRHNRRGIKYVMPGCTEFVTIGRKQPSGAARARSGPEVALEHALAKHLPVDRTARRLQLDDGRPRPVVEVDICVPKQKLVVEYDGSYWHAGKEGADRAKADRLRALGLTVIRVREGLDKLDDQWDVVVSPRSTPDDMARAVLAVLEG